MAAAARATRSKGPASPPLPLDPVIFIDRKRKPEDEVPIENEEEKRRRLMDGLPLITDEEDDFMPKEEVETDDAWTVMFNRLRRLCNPGHKFPRLDFKRDADLIRWLNIQHLHQKDLTKRQRKLLNNIGYDWQRIMFKGTWDDNMEKLVSLKRKDGTFGISGLRVKDPRFYSWAVNARYRARWGGMTSKKINQLRNIGFLEEESSNDERPEPQSRRTKKALPDDDDDRVSADEHHTEEDDSEEVEVAGSEDSEEEDRFDINDISEEEEEAIAILMMEMVNHKPIPRAVPVF